MGHPTIAFWDRTYQEDPDFFGEGASSLARSSLGLLAREMSGGSIVELGCGTGRDLGYFAQHGFEVAGCDLSAVGVRVANLRLSALRQEVPPRSRVAFRDALRFLADLPEGRTDAVFSNLFFNQEVDAERLRRLFHGVVRVLRPEGLHLFAVRSTGDAWYGRGTALGGDVFDPGAGVLPSGSSTRPASGSSRPRSSRSTRCASTRTGALTFRWWSGRPSRGEGSGLACRDRDEGLGRLDPRHLPDLVDHGVEGGIDVGGFDLDDQVERSGHRLDLCDPRNDPEAAGHLIQATDLSDDQEVDDLHLSTRPGETPHPS